MNFLSLCAIVKDEPDLLEWVSYHRVIGVEKFYLYDNGSAKPVAETLKPLVDCGIVRVQAVPGVNMQMAIYNLYLAQHGHETEWCAFIDADEYLWMREMEPLMKGERPIDIRYSIDRWLRTREDVNGISLNWAMFGNSGHVKRPTSCLVIENYLWRGDDSYPLHQFVKSIHRPARTSFVQAHFAYYKDDGAAVNASGQRVYGAFAPVDFSIARINHYVTKSQMEYLNKIPLRRPDGSYRDVPFGHYAQHCSSVKDDSMLARVEETKRMMQEAM